MSPLEHDLLEDARVLGRQLRPDLDAARDGVSARVHRPAQAVPQQHRGWRAPALAGVALALVAVAIPALAAVGAPGRTLPGGPTAGTGSTVVAAEVRGTGLQPVEPALALSRAHEVGVASSGAPTAPPVTGLAACAGAGLTLEIAFDRAQYTQGQAVAISQVLRNTGAQACSVPLDPCRASIAIRGSDGAPVYASGADPTWLCAAAPTTVALAPGGMARLTFTWRPGSCPLGSPPCGRATVALGRYTVDASWGGLDAPLNALPRHLDIGAARQS